MISSNEFIAKEVTPKKAAAQQLVEAIRELAQKYYVVPEHILRMSDKEFIKYFADIEKNNRRPKD